jgi:hypothetical protein
VNCSRITSTKACTFAWISSASAWLATNLSTGVGSGMIAITRRDHTSSYGMRIDGPLQADNVLISTLALKLVPCRDMGCRGFPHDEHRITYRPRLAVPGESVQGSQACLKCKSLNKTGDHWGFAALSKDCRRKTKYLITSDIQYCNSWLASDHPCQLHSAITCGNRRPCTGD